MCVPLYFKQVLKLLDPQAKSIHYLWYFILMNIFIILYNLESLNKDLETILLQCSTSLLEDGRYVPFSGHSKSLILKKKKRLFMSVNINLCPLQNEASLTKGESSAMHDININTWKAVWQHGI